MSRLTSVGTGKYLRIPHTTHFVIYYSKYTIMFRLMGHTLPDNKSIRIALTTIYGIGQERSREILAAAGIDHMTKVNLIDEAGQKKILDVLQNYLLENDLKREIQGHIKRLKEIKCYRGVRHTMGLPVRGQITRKNGRTAKKLLGRAKVRPVLKK